MVWAVSLVGFESQPRSLKSFSSALRKIIDLIPKFLGSCIIEEVVEEDAFDITRASQRSWLQLFQPVPRISSKGEWEDLQNM